MPKFQKGNREGFKKGYVPYNKGQRIDVVNESVQYIRTDTEMADLVNSLPEYGLQTQVKGGDTNFKMLRPKSCTKGVNQESAKQTWKFSEVSTILYSMMIEVLIWSL